MTNPTTNPLDVLGPHRGPCGLCGHPDARHRIADAIVSRYRAGEPAGAVGADYDLDAADVIELTRRWNP